VQTLAHAVDVQLVVLGGGDAMALQAVARAFKRAAVEHDDGPARARGLEQVRHVAPHAGDARHLGHAAAV
jgi:hypothetical protein